MSSNAAVADSSNFPSSKKSAASSRYEIPDPAISKKVDDSDCELLAGGENPVDQETKSKS